jgi:hypothetical protein
MASKQSERQGKRKQKAGNKSPPSPGLSAEQPVDAEIRRAAERIGIPVMTPTFNHEKALRGLLGAVRHGLGGTTSDAIEVIASELGLLMEIVEQDQSAGPMNGANSNAIQIALGSIKTRLELIAAVRGYDPDSPIGECWSNALDYTEGGAS